MEMLYQKLQLLQGKFRTFYPSKIEIYGLKSLQLLSIIQSIGITRHMDEYEKRKLSIFNLLNFLQLCIGLLVPFIGLIQNHELPASQWLIACLPSTVSILALSLNHHKKHLAALQAYFILYPFFTCIVYINGMNLGVELSFVLYGILSVFFLQDIAFMLFTIAFSMISYFMLSVVLKNFRYQLENVNLALYLFNQVLAIIFIYHGLFLIKKENTSYQFRLIKKHRALHKKNLQVEEQKTEILTKAQLLESQKEELAELNSLKNKLFSVIAHDLKSPMYALRNLFGNMQQFDIPAKEIKQTIPEVVKDLNYTISLMENLLQWAKSQMDADQIKMQPVNISSLMQDVTNLLRLQAEAKQIHIKTKSEDQLFVNADKEMINLVLRNLLSNAIKFTPPQGNIEIGVNEMEDFVEVYVQDSGMGISKEAMDKINQNNYYTTKGTASESGTGLGLMLCKEFLNKNGGQMFIESQPGEGSIFSFTLPRLQ